MANPTRQQFMERAVGSNSSLDALHPTVTGQNYDGSGFVGYYGENALVFDGGQPIPANAVAGSTHDLDVGLPALLAKEARYEVVAYNPGTVAVTVRLQNREVMGGAARFPQVAQFGVAAGAVSAPQIVQGWLLGESPARFQASPDALVGATGFTVSVRVRRI